MYQGSSDRNCLMPALTEKQPKIFKQIIEFLFRRPEMHGTLETVLTQQDIIGWNVLTWALSVHFTMVGQITSFLLKRPETLETVLTQKDVGKNNCYCT